MILQDNQYETILESKGWESLDIQEVFHIYGSSSSGIEESESVKRVAFFGENKLPEAKKKSRLVIFFSQFNNALIYVLIFSSVITALLNHWVDTGVILGVVLINSIIGYIQEGKAEKALDSIRKMMSTKATVIRDGKRKEIDASLLVPGDVVSLKMGDKVPADVRIIESSNLKVEEASLTGEAEEVLKTSEPVKEGSDLGDRTSMAYMGTTVRNGTGKGIVVSAGINTELGKINKMMSETKENTTPLIRKINNFGIILSFVVVGASILLYLYGYLIQGFSASEMFLFVIGIAVAAIPEGLPAIMTITLAIGVQQMAKRNAIVRKLPSVETLGSVTVICSDKTGTLTKNEMTVVGLFTSENQYEVEGSGYRPEGRILLNGKEVDPEEDPALLKMLYAAGLSNDAEIINTEDNWQVVGAPTKGALKVLQLKVLGEKLKNETNRIYTIPFDSNYKYMATLNEINEEKYIFVNGAPEKILSFCKNQLNGERIIETDYDWWNNRIQEGASLGRRMIGCAVKKIDGEQSAIDHADVQEGMIFLGVFALIDPPREEAVLAVMQCKNAGIVVKMITGDHALTAMSIGKQLGIGDGTTSMTGGEIETLSDEELRQKVQDCHIFARTTPEHKLRIVKALQQNGQICAMTGDGVNDAPALKKADMGIAMGIKGTEVSKDAADMILTDDNFASIVSAVEEGRTIYDNIKKTLVFILPTNGAEAFSIIVAILAGISAPVTAVQILWVNMITAVTLGLSLSFEPMEPKTMQRPPRNPNEPIISMYFAFRIISVSAFVGLFTLFAFQYYEGAGYDLDWSRTVAVNTLVMGELFYLFNCKKIQEQSIKKDLFNNKVVLYVVGILIVFQMLFTYLPVMNTLFGTVPLTLQGWILPVAAGVSVFLFVELEKWISRQYLKL